MKKENLAIFGGAQAMPHVPPKPWRKVTPEVKAAVNRLMDANIVSISDGSGVIAEFEQNFAAMVGCKYALAMNSGTSTLHAAFVALGVGPGDEVLVPAYTWHASITPIIHCGATPVFCDIDPDTLTIDPRDLERRITKRTKAVCIVHIWGNVCHMDAIMAIVKKHGLKLIEDCSHAHGATWRGRKVGSFGDIGCFSMQGAKAVSGGEAGVATTDDPNLFDIMTLVGWCGRPRIGSNETIRQLGDISLGAKYRPHPWAIAMANEELKRLPQLNAGRSHSYELLNELLQDCPGIELIKPLREAQRGGYLEFKFKLTRDVLKFATRDRIAEAIQAEGVPLSADRYSSFNYTYGLLHTAPLFTTFDCRTIGGGYYDPRQKFIPVQPESLPVSEDVATSLLSMYAYENLDRETATQMAEGIKKVMGVVDLLA